MVLAFWGNITCIREILRRDLSLETKLEGLIRSRVANLIHWATGKRYGGADTPPGLLPFNTICGGGVTSRESPQHTDLLINCAPEPKGIDNLCQVISPGWFILILKSQLSMQGAFHNH